MSMRPSPVRPFPATCALWVLLAGAAGAEDVPLTRDVPIQEYQNQAETSHYDFDAPPRGVFRSIQVTEGFEEELGYRRTHEIVPINPTDTFHTDATPVFIVFAVFPHYQAYPVVGVCFPEQVEGLDPKLPLIKDSMYLALEDETGYLKLLPPGEQWKPGKYKVEIHIGWEVNEISLIGTMRFTVVQASSNRAAP